MRIAIVDDLSGERALLREQLARQLARRGAEAELLEFDSGEAFLAAEKERRFTAAFLDIYMEGMTGMEAARALRKTDTDCLHRSRAGGISGPRPALSGQALCRRGDRRADG